MRDLFIKGSLLVSLLIFLSSCDENEDNTTFLKFKVGDREYKATSLLSSFDLSNYFSFNDANSQTEINGYIDHDDYLTYYILLSDDLRSVRQITFIGANFSGGFCCEDWLPGSTGCSVSLNIIRNDSVVGGLIHGEFSGTVKKGSEGMYGYNCTGSMQPINGEFRLKIEDF